MKDIDMKIEKNIPLRKRAECTVKYKIVDELEVGDSILLKDEAELRAARNRAQKAHPDWKVTTRKEGSEPYYLAKHRLWRIE